MSKVYILERVQYDECTTIGVFSSMEKLKKYKKYHLKNFPDEKGDLCVEEKLIDPADFFPKGKTCYYVSSWLNGEEINVDPVKILKRDQEECKAHCRIYDCSKYLYFTIWVSNTVDAKHIASALTHRFKRLVPNWDKMCEKQINEIVSKMFPYEYTTGE